jgi:hypothetical protein
MSAVATQGPLPIEERDEDADADSEQDPLDGAPEETEPVDYDEPELEDQPSHWTGRQPDITFIPARPARARPDLGTTRLVRSPRSTRGIRYRIRPVTSGVIGSVDDNETATMWEERLDQLAEALIDSQDAALRAPNATAAYEALEPMTERQLADLAQVEPTWLSRNRYLLVRSTWGAMPLEFFWWKGRDEANLAPDLRALYRELLQDSSRPDLAIARAAAEHTMSRPSIREHQRRADALRKHLPYLRIIAAQATQLESYRSSFPFISIEELGTALEMREGRGLNVLRLALLGVLGHEAP